MIQTKYWYNKVEKEVEEFPSEICNKDGYRPATYEEVKESKLMEFKRKRKFVLDNGFKSESGNYRHWKYGVKTLDEAYDLLTF